jgi:hypothetical protein
VYRPPTLLLTLGAHRAVPPRLAAAWLLGCLAPWLLLAAAAAADDLIIIVGPHGTATATTDGVLAGGYLTDRYLGQPPPRRRPGTASLGKYLQTIEQAGGWGQLQRVLRACRLVADRHPGVSIANVATRWVLDQDAVAGERGHGSIVDAAPMLAEIYLRHACSYHEILRVKTQPAETPPRRDRGRTTGQAQRGAHAGEPAGIGAGARCGGPGDAGRGDLARADAAGRLRRRVP